MLSGFLPVSVLAAEPQTSVISWPALRTFVRAVHKCSPTPLDTATQLAPTHPHPAHFTICCPLTLWSQLDYKTCGGKNSQAPQTASSPSPDLLCTTNTASQWCVEPYCLHLALLFGSRTTSLFLLPATLMFHRPDRRTSRQTAITRAVPSQERRGLL